MAFLQESTASLVRVTGVVIFIRLALLANVALPPTSCVREASLAVLFLSVWLNLDQVLYMLGVSSHNFALSLHI